MSHAYADYLRWLYRSGRPNAFARLQNKLSAWMFAAGIWPRRAAALQVRGRKTGQVTSFPVAIAEQAGERYLVSMLGERANWVRNVRADAGRAVLIHGRREDVTLAEVAVSERAPILKAYVAVAPGARPHIRVDPHAPIAEFERVAASFPVFRILRRSS